MAENFPIADTRNNFVLEFLDYYIDAPRYSIEECLERGLTYSVPLRAKLKLFCTDPDHEEFETVEQSVFLGPIPYMTEMVRSSSMVLNASLYLSCTVLLVCSLAQAFTQMVHNFIVHVSFLSREAGLNLPLTSTA